MAPNNGDYDFFAGGAGPARPAQPSAPPSAGPPASQFGSFGAPAASGGFAQPGTTVPLQRGAPMGHIASNTRSGPPKQLISLAAVAVVAVLAVVGFQAAHVSARITYARTSVTMPTAVAGYTIATGPAADQINAAVDAQKPSKDVKTPKMGLYLDASGKPALLAIAAKFSKPALVSKDAQDQVFGKDVAAAAGGAFGSFSNIPSGKLGGVLRCGSGTADGYTMRACGSVDAGAMTVLIFYDAKTPDATVLAARQAVEHRR